MRAVVLVVVLSSFRVMAQSGAAVNGVAPEWDIRSNMAALVADVKRMESLVNRVDAPDWVQRGAPDAYIRQSQSTKDAMVHLTNATERLSREPERLTAALDTFFELERVELLVGSLRDGVRKWQSEYTATEMSQTLNANMIHRERLRQHIRDLAASRENEFKIVNEEAQRCRGTLTRQPPPLQCPPSRPAPKSGRSSGRR